MTLLDAIIEAAGSLGERTEDLVTDATPEQLALDMETSALSDLYASFFGRTYVFVPFFDGRRNLILDVHRNPDSGMGDTAPLLSRLVEI
jgi:hypothetical protein